MHTVIKCFLSRPVFYTPLILMLASVTALAGAYISQYVFGYQPCNLCLYQRVPYAVVIGLSLLALFLRSKPGLIWWIVGICVLALMVEVGIAAFHVGVEQKWWEGLDTCGGGDVPMTMEELRAMIANAPLARCDDPGFYFLGLTMAAWNVFYALSLAVLGIVGCIGIKRHFMKKEE